MCFLLLTNCKKFEDSKRHRASPSWAHEVVVFGVLLHSPTWYNIFSTVSFNENFVENFTFEHIQQPRTSVEEGRLALCSGDAEQ